MTIIPSPNQDEIDLNNGAEAYQKGDFKTAVDLYTKSAQAGNVTALSNLGYCYYYGRSIPVDKEKAKECWTKAALMDDVCAIYKLGDMYRNGDLPKDEKFAKNLYVKAYLIAKEEIDDWTYPDAVLRILKYCRDEYDNSFLKEIACQAIECFEYRIREGDRYSDKLLEEMKRIYEQL